jgi:hypothetical protein
MIRKATGTAGPRPAGDVTSSSRKPSWTSVSPSSTTGLLGGGAGWPWCPLAVVPDRTAANTTAPTNASAKPAMIAVTIRLGRRGTGGSVSLVRFAGPTPLTLIRQGHAQYRQPVWANQVTASRAGPWSTMASPNVSVATRPCGAIAASHETRHFRAVT